MVAASVKWACAVDETLPEESAYAVVSELPDATQLCSREAERTSPRHDPSVTSAGKREPIGEPPARMRVRVVDMESQCPVPGLAIAVSLFVLDDDRLLRVERVVTDAEGLVSFSLPAGTTAAFALHEADYYLVDDGCMAGPRSSQPTTIRVRRGDQLLGRVVDGNGRGVSGACVSVNHGRRPLGAKDGDNDRPMDWYPAALATTTTDGGGYYTLRGVARSQRWRIFGEHAQYALASIELAGPTQERGAFQVPWIVLDAGFSLRVAVRDDNDRALGGAELQLVADTSVASTETVLRADAGGIATFTHLAAGTFRLHALAPGHSPQERKLPLAGSQEISVQLPVCIAIRGRVFDADGMPASVRR